MPARGRRDPVREGEGRRAQGPDLFLKASMPLARGVDSPQGFVVRTGSTAVKAEVPSIHAYLTELRRTSSGAASSRMPGTRFG